MRAFIKFTDATDVRWSSFALVSKQRLFEFCKELIVTLRLSKFMRSIVEGEIWHTTKSVRISHFTVFSLQCHSYCSSIKSYLFLHRFTYKVSGDYASEMNTIYITVASREIEHFHEFFFYSTLWMKYITIGLLKCGQSLLLSGSGSDKGIIMLVEIAIQSVYICAFFH